MTEASHCSFKKLLRFGRGSLFWIQYRAIWIGMTGGKPLLFGARRRGGARKKAMNGLAFAMNIRWKRI